MSHSTLTIISLFFEETQPCRQMYHRPYEPVITDHEQNIISDRIGALTRNDPAATITSNVLAGVGRGIMLPAATPEKAVAIPVGWENARFKFVLTVEEQHPLLQTPIRYYFQGYTDIMDMSMINNYISPDTRCMINSFIKTTMVPDPRTGGYRENIVSSGQVINGRLISNMENTNVYTARPEDIFQGIQGNWLSNAYTSNGGGELKDTRIKKNTESVISGRNNGVPSTYMAEVINSYMVASNVAEYGNLQEDVFGRAVAASLTSNIEESPFLHLLGQYRGHGGVTDFSLKELQNIDPEIGRKIKYVPWAPGAGAFDPIANSNGWAGANDIDRQAAMISNAVGAIMSSLMLVSLNFTCHNGLIGGGVLTTISDCKAMTNADARPLLSMFKQRFETEVVPDISMGGIRTFTIEVYADMFNMTYMQISINGGPVTPYAVPSYADSLFSPVVSTSENNFANITGTTELILNSCRSNNDSNGRLAALLATADNGPYDSYQSGNNMQFNQAIQAMDSPVRQL